MKIGLVLAGGGGKGAYHIGVWKAFREYGVDQNIIAVSGTSVGALNAALFMEGDFSKAENIWRNITHDKILSLPSTKQVIGFLSGLGIIAATGVIASFMTSLGFHGVFSRSGLLDIIENEVDLAKVSNSSIQGYGAALRIPNLSIDYFSLNNSSPDRIASILLASSAIPVAFPMEEIDGNQYLDGGIPLVGDNQPIQPLYDQGCETIFVVHLSRESLIDKEKFPNAQILEIVPQDHPGGFFSGTLDFSPSGAARRIEEGYSDTIAILKPIFDMVNVQRGLIKSSERMLEDEIKTRSIRNENKKVRQGLKNEFHDLIGDNS